MYMRLVLLILLIGPTLRTVADDAPKSPDDRLAVELFVTAPQVKHPTGLAIDKQGRVYVIESHTHFRPDGYVGPNGDKIYSFANPDTNGLATERITFAEGCDMVMDLLMGKDGWLYVAERSRIRRLRDTDSLGLDFTGSAFGHLDIGNGVKFLCETLACNAKKG